MNIDRDNLRNAYTLLDELENLESCLDIIEHKDAAMTVAFYTIDNDGKDFPKQDILVYLKKSDFYEFFKGYLIKRIDEIKNDLKSM